MTSSVTQSNQATIDHWAKRAQYWIKWAEHIAPGEDEFTRQIFAAIDLRDGHELLDLASGPGEPALKAAAAVGPDGLVIATDIVPDMICGLRDREDTSQYRHLHYAAADMQYLPFADARFDRITCRFGIMFVEDPVLAFREMRRVLRPSGRAVLMFWGPRDDTPIFLLNRDVAVEVLGLPAPPSDKADRFGDAGSISNAMSEAGLVDIVELEHRVVKREPIGEPFWRAYFEMTFGPQLTTHDPDIMNRLDQVMLRHLEPYRIGDEFHLKAHMRLAVGNAG